MTVSIHQLLTPTSPDGKLVAVAVVIVGVLVTTCNTWLEPSVVKIGIAYADRPSRSKSHELVLTFRRSGCQVVVVLMDRDGFQKGFPL